MRFIRRNAGTLIKEQRLEPSGPCGAFLLNSIAIGPGVSWLYYQYYAPTDEKHLSIFYQEPTVSTEASAKVEHPVQHLFFFISFCSLLTHLHPSPCSLLHAPCLFTFSPYSSDQLSPAQSNAQWSDEAYTACCVLMIAYSSSLSPSF